jgi:hypothetical protein
MYKTLLATSTGTFINAQVFDAQMVMRMMELSDHGRPALGGAYRRAARQLAESIQAAGRISSQARHAFAWVRPGAGAA